VFDALSDRLGAALGDLRKRGRLDDESICDVPLLERRRLLESVLVESHLVRVGVFVKPPVDGWPCA